MESYILLVTHQNRLEKPSGYDIHSQTKEDFDKGICSAPLTEHPFKTKTDAISWGKKMIASGAYGELWVEKVTKCTREKEGKRVVVRIKCPT